MKTQSKTQEVKKSLLKTINTEKGNESMESEDEMSLDSDEELQLAFARKELKPGLNVQVEQPKKFVNDEETLKNKLKDIYLNMDWIERMDVTVSVEKEDLIDSNKTIDLVDNDFKRESLFLRQAEAAIKIALPRFKSLNVPVKQPKDYIAEMVKSQKHMEKVKEAVLSKQAEIEKREKVRKLRELKKMGKQIQMEAEKKKQMAKKKLNESIKKFKKGDKDSLEIALEDDDKPTKRKSNDAGENRDKRMKKMDNNGHPKKSKKTEYKDKKFGFGGRKKRSKYNTADSYAEPFNMKNKNKNKTKNPKKFLNKNKRNAKRK